MPMTSGAANLPRLVVEEEPRPEDIRFLEEGLYAFNVEATGISDAKVLSLFLRADDGSPMAGVFGWTWGGTCYIRYLYVGAGIRFQGKGRRLMQAVETEARIRGCGQIVLETHSFQAPDFYRKLGFEVTGQVAGYPAGHAHLTLVKQLT
jgi:GNAT superfamily N-acetyltransferase